MHAVRLARSLGALAAGVLLVAVPAVPAAPATAAEMDRPSGTGAASGSGTATAQDPAQLADIEVATHDTYDRVVFDYGDSAVPGYRVAYGSVQEPGSGKRVQLRGSHSLQVTLRETTGTRGGSYEGPTDFVFRMPSVAQVTHLGSFERVAEAGVGITADSQVGFRVFTLSDPARLVIDVAHEGPGSPGDGNGGGDGGGDEDQPRTVIADYEQPPMFRVEGFPSEGGYCLEVTDFAAVRSGSTTECEPFPTNERATHAFNVRGFDKGPAYTVVITTDDRAAGFGVVANDGSVIPDGSEDFQVVPLEGPTPGRAFAPHYESKFIKAIEVYDDSGTVIDRVNIGWTPPPGEGSGDGSPEQTPEDDQIPPGQTPKGGVATGFGGLTGAGARTALLALGGATALALLAAAGTGALATRRLRHPRTGVGAR